MSFSKNDNSKAGQHLENNDWKKQSNGDGYQKGSTVWKPTDSGGSWISNKGDKISDWSNFGKSKKTK